MKRTLFLVMLVLSLLSVQNVIAGYPFRDGLGPYYSFDSDKLLNDSTPYGINGTSFGTNTYSSTGGVVGGYYDMGGTASDYFSFPDNAQLDYGTGSFTISCWITDDANADRHPIEKFTSQSDGDGSATGWYWRINTNDSSNVGLYESGVTSQHTAVSMLNGAAFTMHTWTYNATSGNSSQYKNGTQISSITMTARNLDNNRPLIMGKWNWLDNNPYGGKIDECGLWKGRALTNTEVQTLYDVYINGSNPWLYSDTPTQPTLTINVQNAINGTTLSGFCINATGSNTTQNLCNSTGNAISFNTTGLYNITVYNINNSYYNVTQNNFNFSITQTLTLYTHQANVTFTVVDLTTNNENMQWNISYGVLRTNYSNKNYYFLAGNTLVNITGDFWNITNYNITNISLFSDNTVIIPVYNKRLSFINNITNQNITASCDVNGTTYSGLQINFSTLNLTTAQLTYVCHATTFQNRTVTDNKIVNNNTIALHPNMLSLIFSNATDVEILWSDNGINRTNITTILEIQNNISIGYVYITFNNKKQQYQYYNTQNTTINDNVMVYDTNYENQFTIIDSVTSAPVPYARLTLKKIYNNITWVVQSVFSGQQGTGQVIIIQGDSYQYTIQKDGYLPQSSVINFGYDGTAKTFSITPIETSSSIITVNTNITNEVMTTRGTIFSSTQSSSSDNIYNLRTNINSTTATGVINITICAENTTTSLICNHDLLANTTLVCIDSYKNEVKIHGICYKNKVGNQTIEVGVGDTNTWQAEPFIGMFIILVVSIIAGLWIEGKKTGWGLGSTTLLIGLFGFIYPVLYMVSGTFLIIYILKLFRKGTE